MKNLKRTKFLELAYVDGVETQNVDPTTIVNYPLLTADELVKEHEFAETDSDAQAGPSIRKMWV